MAETTEYAGSINYKAPKDVSGFTRERHIELFKMALVLAEHLNGLTPEEQKLVISTLQTIPVK